MKPPILSNESTTNDRDYRHSTVDAPEPLPHNNYKDNTIYNRPVRAKTTSFDPSDLFCGKHYSCTPLSGEGKKKTSFIVQTWKRLHVKIDKWNLFFFDSTDHTTDTKRNDRVVRLIFKRKDKALYY